MASLKDVKVKIAGVRKTKQITKAMNMVASAKLRMAQTRIERFRPYADKFRTVLADLAGKSEGNVHPLLENRPDGKNAIIVLVTSDRGLAGAFNASLVAKALDLARAKTAEGKSVRFICVGKKGRDAVRKAGYEMHSSYADRTNTMDFPLASRIGKDVIAGYTGGEMDDVSLIYSLFGSLTRQIPTVLQLLPMERSAQAEEGSSREYVYEPDAASLLGELLPRFVNVQLYRGLLDTSASENAARMTAMDNATRNCDEMAATLTLLYNKTRQASITNELIDIVGGAEALK